MSILQNCLYKKSFKIYLLDPKTDEVQNILVFFWNLPGPIKKLIAAGNVRSAEVKSYFGKDYKSILELDDIKGAADDFEIDFENVQESDIESFDNKLESVQLKKVNYITDVCIFPEDSFWTLRQKIYVATNIPVYRQHIFYLQQSYHKSGYSILIQDIEYPISKAKDTTAVMGIKVDYNMNFNREDIRIRMEETCSIIDELADQQFYMYDLNDYFREVSKTAISADKISFEVIYYSLIRKYFPVIDMKMFKKYLEDESELIKTYHLINTSKETLESRFAIENKLLTAIYDKSPTLHEKYMPNIAVELVEVEIRTPPSDRDTMEIRNLIDIIQTNKTYSMIDAYISHNRSKYRVIKNWVGLEKHILDQVTKTKEDYFGQDFLVVYFELEFDYHSIYIYADGSYMVKCGFFKTHDINLSNLIGKISPYVGPILDLINKNREYLFCSVLPFEIKNITLGRIHAKIRWNRILNDKQFVEMHSVLSEYASAGILQKRNVAPKPNTYMFKLVKGMYKTNVRLYLKKGVESADYYVVFKDTKTFETWNNRWGGENMDVINNMANITFEVYGMDSVKFIRSVNYIFGIMADVDRIVKQEHLTKKESIEKTNKTSKKKFKEIDPKLYDMEDEKGTKYARICQKKHRPTNIYTKAEYELLPQNDRKYTYPFINYTNGETVYYKCSEKMPFLGFIVGKHKDGLCIPKCKKTETAGIKNKQIWTACTSKHTINRDEIETKTHNDNILKFGKHLEEGKVGFCHDSIYSIFKLNSEDFLLAGIFHTYDNVTGGDIADIIAYQLDMTPELFIETIDSKLDKTTWMGVVSATMDFEDFKKMLADIRQNKVVNKIDIKDIIIELSAIIFDLHVIIFETHVIQHAELLNKSNSSVYMRYTNLTKFAATTKQPMRYSIICEIYDSYYPAVYVDVDEDIKIFATTTKFGKRIGQIIRKIGKLDADPYKLFEYKNISSQLTVTKKYIWNKYIMYVATREGPIVSCLNSVNVADGKSESYDFLDVSKLGNGFETTNAFLKKHLFDPPIFIDYQGSITGCRMGQILMWFAPTDYDQIASEYSNPRIEYMICNPAEINLAITRNTKPEQKYKKDLFPLYYDIYIYKLFRCEFYKLLMEYRDLSSHNKIVDKFKANEIIPYLQNNPGDFPYSAKKILKIVKYDKDPAAVLKAELFIEDIIKLRNSLIARADVAEFIKRVCDRFIVISEVTEYPIDNILYSHVEFRDAKFGDQEWRFEVVADEYKSLFYDSGKLKMLEKIYPEMIRMLVEDLRNYDMFRYDIMNFKLMFVINYLNFRNYDSEKIIIQSL